MKLVRPSYEIIEQGPGLQGIYDIIERCGKTSYKSEVKGGETARKFVENRAKERHGAVLEFGTVYLKLSVSLYDEDYMEKKDVPVFYKENHHSKVVSEEATIRENGVVIAVTTYYITTNYRVLVENNRLDDLKYLCEPTEYHEKRYAVKFVTDIGLGRDFLRHRVMTMVQESTRYINYNRGKYGHQCCFVIPPWIGKDVLAEGENVIWWDGDWVDFGETEDDFPARVPIRIVKYGGKPHNDRIDQWLLALNSAENAYNSLTNDWSHIEGIAEEEKKPWIPDQARGVLPLSTKTELVLCGFKDAWIHFFRLRSDMAVTGKAHPMSIQLATPLRDEFVERGYLTVEDLQHDLFEPFDVAISDKDLTT